MSEAEVIIALRTFSGPNLGAEVMLPPGTYIIGTDYSCDIVLADSSMAARHAALTAEQPRPGERAHVHVKPLDGDILLEEHPLPAEGGDIPPATPWFLGLTCLSWNMPGAPREEIIPRLPGLSSHAPEKEEAAGPANSIDRPVAGKEERPTDNTVAINMPTPLAKSRRWPIRLAALLLLTLLGALIFEFKGSSDSTGELAAKLRQELHQAGISTVVVSSENDRITVSGSVLNEQERSQVWSVARNLKRPVYIRVGVRDDIAQAITMKFNSNGIFPEVTFPDGGETMRVAAYIKDSATENAAFAALKADTDMPDLPPIEKHVVHAAQLQAIIEKELDRARLRNVTIFCGTGRVELTDTSSSGNHNALQEVMKGIEENLHIPLAYTIISQDSPPSGAGGNTQTVQTLVPGGISPDMPAAASPSGNSSLEELHVTGVTLTPMRFISLGDGQRVFEGGTLPDGHILESISLDALILSKNGRTTTYPLRGRNE